MDTIREVSPQVWVSTSQIMQTNSVILVGDDRAFLVDPAWRAAELAAIGEFISHRNLTLMGGFATHAHHDHLLWDTSFPDAPRWASQRTAEVAHTERDALLSQMREGYSPEALEMMGRVSGTDELTGEMVPPGFTVELIVHDGHAPGHTALWLEEQGVLIAGDMLSDVELPLPFYPDDLASYVTAMEVLKPYAARARLVIPGHGSVGSDAEARWDKDWTYLHDVMIEGYSTDPRIAHNDMAEEYQHLRRLAREKL